MQICFILCGVTFAEDVSVTHILNNDIIWIQIWAGASLTLSCLHPV